MENKEEEIWKDIKGYEYLYQVSNKGRVKSLKRTCIGRGGNCTRTVKERILATKSINLPYDQVCLFIESRRDYPLVHRLVANAFIPNPENKPQVNHKDGVKRNNNVENLEWATVSENGIHAYANGLQKHQYGSMRYCSKLNEEKVKDIKLRLLKKERVGEIAKIYEVHSVTITDIKKGRTWVRVTL